jgi:DNA replication initiation complex subunit (GINS family)
MLLVELLKLFSNNFDINEERFISIIQTNNIKLSQRLLVEVSFEKKIITNVTNKINEAPINETNIITSNTNISNISNTNATTNATNTKEDVSEPNLKKKESSGRGRGRPRKTCEVKEEDSVLVEVEVIEIGGTEYYKTCENVIINKELEIEGILRDGKVVRKRAV